MSKDILEKYAHFRREIEEQGNAGLFSPIFVELYDALQAAVAPQPDWDNAPEPSVKYIEVNSIKPIICACGSESCYRGLTVGNDGELFLDYDVSDPRGSSVSFTLPKGYVLHKVVKT
jgi:hypothetical protein